MAKTKIKVYLRNDKGEKDSFVIEKKMPEDEAHKCYLNKWIGEGENRKKCYMVATIEKQD